MAGNASKATVRLSMNEKVSDLVNHLRFPEAVGELVLRNCIASEPAELCEQISRCPILRILRCCANVLRPSQLLQLTLQQLPRLERLELSLVVDAAVDSEIGNLRGLASQSAGVIPSHGLRQMYVEVGGHRNFELLQELLKFYPKLTELHVHYVRGDLSDAVLRYHRLLEELLLPLELFTFTSELTASLPTPDAPMLSPALRIYAAMCDNFRHEPFDSCTTNFELDILMGSDRATILPSQLAVLAIYSELMAEQFRVAGIRNVWTHVRELCILLLPPDACVEFYPTAGPAFREDLDSQAVVRSLAASCRRLRDLDVRLERRRGHFRCRSCELLRDQEIPQPPSRAATLSSSRNSGITGLTLCGVPSNVLLWFIDCYGDAVKLRLSEWSVVKSLQCSHLCRLLGENNIRCLVLKHQHLPISDKHLQASLCHLTSLQHLCLLTSMQVSDVEATKFAREISTRARGLQCVHMHYRHDADGPEQRVTWLRGHRRSGLLRDRPCFGCCSTATFIGLVKPVNRDCDADL
ncbi:hypothetical protein MTO96_006993 [Rhipicephalus appendiculatus]